MLFVLKKCSAIVEIVLILPLEVDIQTSDSVWDFTLPRQEAEGILSLEGLFSRFVIVETELCGFR